MRRLALTLGAALLPGLVHAQPQPWWDTSYLYRQNISVTAGASVLPAQYSVMVTTNHAATVAAGKSRADGDDVRVARWDGAAWTELDRSTEVRSSWNLSDTKFWFKLQAAVGAGQTDTSYWLYYGKPAAANPPAAAVGGMPVRSLSSGTVVTLPAGGTNITIPAVSTASALVLCSFKKDFGGAGDTDRGDVACDLVGPTTLRVHAADVNSTAVVWTVIEFASGVFVQRGTLSGSWTSPADITLSVPAPENRSFVVLTSSGGSPPNVIADAERTILGQLVSSMTLRLQRDDPGLTTTQWQVVTMAGARVQSQSTDITTLVAAATLTSPVDLSRSFATFTLKYNLSGGNAEDEYRVRGALSSATTFKLERRAVASTPASCSTRWFAVELATGARVSSGTVTGTNGSGDLTGTLAAVDTSRAILFHSNDACCDGMKYSFLTGVFTSGTGVSFARIPQELLTLDWYAVEFPPNLANGTALAPEQRLRRLRLSTSPP